MPVVNPVRRTSNTTGVVPEAPSGVGLVVTASASNRWSSLSTVKVMAESLISGSWSSKPWVRFWLFVRVIVRASSGSTVVSPATVSVTCFCNSPDVNVTVVCVGSPPAKSSPSKALVATE